MSVSGAVINDSHAEIISRRCLMDFIYNQLELHLKSGLFLIYTILFIIYENN